MDDLLRYVRTSSTRLNGARTRLQPAEEDESDSPADLPLGEDGLPNYTLISCKHVREGKWEQLLGEVLEPKLSCLTGIVAVNPAFARSYYVPTSVFRCGYDDQIEYQTVASDLLASMKTLGYEVWMAGMVRPDSAFISLHVCQAAELLDRLCTRLPVLARLSLHFYHLDGDFVAYLVRHHRALVSLNLENSTGLTTRSYGTLALLPKLAHLNLAGADVTEKAVGKILSGCLNLESLNLSNNCQLTGQCLRQEAMKNIRRLNLRDCWGINGPRLAEMTSRGLPNLFELIVNSGVTDDSLVAIGRHCGNLMHLDISFEEFTYYDDTGAALLSDRGFAGIAQLADLRVLRLRHVGRLTDQALGVIARSCAKLSELTLNLRHRHKLTDQRALETVVRACANLKYFEAVHNHFIGQASLSHLAELYSSLKYLILRGDELIPDEGAARLVRSCPALRMLILDGCGQIQEKTLTACICAAHKIPVDVAGNKEELLASLVATALDRSVLEELFTSLPANLRIRVSDQRRNKEHYNEFDGKKVAALKLRTHFYPFYWQDFN